MLSSEEKLRFLKTLEEDIEFRYAVAGYLGLSEILRRLDSLVEEQTRLREEQIKIWSEIARIWEEIKALREEQTRLRQDMIEGFRRHDEELAKLREDMVAGFKRHDEEIAKLREDMIAGFRRHDEELAKLRQDMMEGFRRHDEILAMHAQEIAKLREDMVAGFKRHDEILAMHAQEIAKLRQDMMEGFRRHDEEFARIWVEIKALREDMRDGFDSMRRHIDALGARWGMISEEAFREGIRGLVEKDLGFKIEKWVRSDDRGIVYGYPSQVDIDVAVHDDKVILIEVKSHIRRGDVYEFKRKSEFYSIVEGRKPDRLMMVTPYADEEARRIAEELGIEVYTSI